MRADEKEATWLLAISLTIALAISLIISLIMGRPTDFIPGAAAP